jgi:hypothetical protein
VRYGAGVENWPQEDDWCRPSVFIDMPVSFFNQIKYRLSILHFRNANEGQAAATVFPLRRALV